MRCRKCGAPAAINMREHKLALCRDHFLEWIPEQTEHAIRHYRMFARGEKILVAVSGGKDSLSLWDVLHRLGYAADGLYIDRGIDAGIAYSSKSREFCEQFAARDGVEARRLPRSVETSRQTCSQAPYPLCRNVVGSGLDGD